MAFFEGLRTAHPSRPSRAAAARQGAERVRTVPCPSAPSAVASDPSPHNQINWSGRRKLVHTVLPESLSGLRDMPYSSRTVGVGVLGGSCQAGSCPVSRHSVPPGYIIIPYCSFPSLCSLYWKIVPFCSTRCAAAISERSGESTLGGLGWSANFRHYNLVLITGRWLDICI